MNPLSTVKIKDGESYRIINESDFKQGIHELCEGEKLSTVIAPIVVSAQVGITPELQQVIDDAKAECKKVTAENVVLTANLEKVTGERDALIIQVGELQAVIDSAQPANNAPTAVETEQAVQEKENQAILIDHSAWTIEQIKSFLAEKNIGFKASSTKPELLALIPKG